MLQEILLKLSNLKKMNKRNKIISWILIIGNLLGALYGFIFWYGQQLLNSPFYLWIFIPASPLFVFLFLTCFILLIFRIRNDFLFFLTATGLVKFGIWTVIFWVTYSLQKPFSLGMILFLVITHLIMVFESIILFGYINLNKRGLFYLFLTYSYFLGYDYFAFFRGTLTNKIAIPSISFSGLVAFILTLLSPVIIYFLVKKKYKRIDFFS